MADATTGGCLCGRVRFTIDAAPAASRVCWCRECQRIAANGTVNVLFPTGHIALAGSPASYERRAASGNTVTLRFCPACGTQLFSDSSGRPGWTVVRAGTLDAPSAFRPSANIWADSAPDWACLDDALERHAGQPAPPPAPAR